MKHTHKYGQVKLGSNGYTVYKCFLPNCPHYVRKELALGRFSICWKCGGTFIMTATSIERLKPKCLDCIAETVALRKQAAQEEKEAS